VKISNDQRNIAVFEYRGMLRLEKEAVVFYAEKPSERAESRAGIEARTISCVALCISILAVSFASQTPEIRL
jgi:hypothetical protein